MKRGLFLALICVIAASVLALASQEHDGAGALASENRAERSLSDRYKAVALEETRSLALRTCRTVARAALFKAFSTVDDPSDDNYIALGYAATLPSRPLALQGAAYDGCRRGLRARSADSQP